MKIESAADGPRSDPPSQGKPNGVVPTAGNSSYRWLALFIVWGAFLLSYTVRVAWNPIMAPVGASLGIKVALLGAFVTAFYTGYVIANILGGMITDVFGGRLTLAASLFLLGGFTYAFGYTDSLAVGIAIQALMGLTAGADYAAGMKIIATWFSKDRGRAMGLYTTATSLAVIIANAVAPSFTAAYGWVKLYHVMGFITFAWGIVALLLLRKEAAHPHHVHASPVKFGHTFSVLRNRNLIVLAIAGFGGLWATVGFRTWGNSLMIKGHDISPVVAGAVMAWFGIGALVAKPVFGWVSDLHWVSRKVFSIFLFSMAVVFLVVFGYCTTVTQFYIVATLIGVFGFAYLPVLMAQISDATGSNLAGAGAGWTNAIWQTGSAISPLAVGYAYSATNSFLASLLVLAIGPVIGVLSLLLIKSEPRSKGHSA
ncbi:MAG: MFS transporter [Betaproteobacteria bacterium]|nr:MFS transporter [Betaproteobacteria bacterium]